MYTFDLITSEGKISALRHTLYYTLCTWRESVESSYKYMEILPKERAE